MPTRTDRKKQARGVLIRMMLDLHTLVRSSDRPTEEMLVGFAVRLAQYEGKAADASMIAESTRLPRTSVQRHIKALEQRGRIRSSRIGRRIVHYIPMASEPADVEPFYDAAEAIVRAACSDLTKMGSLGDRHES